MIRALCLALALAAGSGALAQPVAPPADELAVLSRVLAAIRVDLVDDVIGKERVLLVASSDADLLAADLVIVAGAPDARAGEVLLIVPSIVYAGTMAGQVPSLAVAANGSLILSAEQTGIGRSAWEQDLTIAERDGVLRVAGFTTREWDRLTGGTMSCDWNLLTGAYEGSFAKDVDTPAETLSGRKPAMITLTAWETRPDTLPDACRMRVSEDG